MSGSCASSAWETHPLASHGKKGLVGSTAEARGIVSGSGLVKVLDAMCPVQPSVALSFTPTSIVELFAEEVPNRVKTEFKSTLKTLKRERQDFSFVWRKPADLSVGWLSVCSASCQEWSLTRACPGTGMWFGLCLEPRSGSPLPFCRRLTILETIFFRIGKLSQQVKAAEFCPKPDVQAGKGFHEEALRLALLEFVDSGFSRKNAPRRGPLWKSMAVVTEAIATIKVKQICCEAVPLACCECGAVGVLRGRVSLLVNECRGSWCSDDRILYIIPHAIGCMVEVGEFLCRFRTVVRMGAQQDYMLPVGMAQMSMRCW